MLTARETALLKAAEAAKAAGIAHSIARADASAKRRVADEASREESVASAALTARTNEFIRLVHMGD